MKFKVKSKKRTQLKTSARIRLPKDYPWKVLGHMANDLSQFLQDDDYELITTIIRNRDYYSYRLLSEVWGLQCMSPGTLSCACLRARYQLAALLKKFQFPSDASTRKENAMKKFVTAEILCRSYNRNGYKRLSRSEIPRTQRIFSYARIWIQKVLGYELPSIEVMTDKSRHGPGAASSTRNGLTSAYFKYADWPYDVTQPAVGYAVSLIKQDERWLGALEDSYRERYNIPKHMILNQDTFWSNVLNVVKGNRITFVPKSSEIDRTIAIEPTLNLYLQLGVDGFIRRRLKRWSIDLDNQWRNRELARQGSMTSGPSSAVTLDLSMASDTISRRLCMELLPPEWYDYLMALRSPSGLLDERLFKYEKISSMGNGFTFALESLIFASIIYGVGREKLGEFDFSACAVYGDDLIVPKYLAEDVIVHLKKAGFALNIDKSFVQGPVRESCGADWLEGRPVRPINLTKTPTNLKELFTDINRLKRILSLRYGVETSTVETQLQRYVPSKFKTLVGPYSDEDFDSYLHSNKKTTYKYGLWRFKRLISRSKMLKGRKVGLLPFRKLMHQLKPIPPRNKWEKPATGGSVFEVHGRNDQYLAFTNSVSEIWRIEYAELSPPKTNLFTWLDKIPLCGDSYACR